MIRSSSADDVDPHRDPYDVTIAPPRLERSIVAGVTVVSIATAAWLLLAVAGVFGPVSAAGALALGVAVSVAVTRRVRRTVLVRLPRWAIVAGVAIAALSVAGQMWFSGEHLLTDRDPGVYLNTGVWVKNHGTLLVDGTNGPFADIDTVDADWLGYYDVRDDGRLYPQFTHGYPSLLASVGLVTGVRGMLWVNAVVGGVVLVMLLLLAGQVAAPWVAVVVTAATAVNLSFFYFFRDTYSEPLALMLTLGIILATLIGVDRSNGAALTAAGFAAGALLTVRIDAWLIFAGWVFLMSLWIISPHRPRVSSRAIAMGVGAATIVGSAGLVDLLLRAPTYAERRPLALPLVLLAVASVVGFALCWGLRGRVRTVSARIDASAFGRNLPRVSAGLFLACCVLALFVRPLFPAHGKFNAFVAAATAEVGVSDGTRTMAESSMVWFTWYWGWIAVALVIVGLTLVIAHARHGRSAATIALAVGAMLMIGYLIRPSITPDQVWAMRRFLVPGTAIVVLGLAVSLQSVSSWLATQRSIGPVVRRAILGALAVAVVGVPAVVALPVATARTQQGLLGSTNAVCEALPDGAVVLVTDDSLGRNFAPAVRSICDVPTATVTAGVEDGALAASAERLASRGLVPVLLSAPSGSPPSMATSSVRFRVTETPLFRTPSRFLSRELGWSLSTIVESGGQG